MGHDAATLPPNILRRMCAEDRRSLGKDGLTPEEREDIYLDGQEKALQKDIAEFLRLRDIPYDQDRMDRRRGGTKGWPDFTFPYRGRFVAIEAKAGRGKPDADQEKVIAALQGHGAIVAVVYSISELKTLLDSIQ